MLLVKKPNSKWQMYMNFTDLNKVCLKDQYPLPSIDMLVDSILGHTIVSFYDAILGYHQILMELEDAEKTTFIRDERAFYHR